ncbi:triose-phosphate isomerase [Candidatus Peregrinibacteria bacterium CG10_big_fil_rev_8_21_14_0_10_55_24]|nr:MAG: triose-phosphate isomerase [Candidatus Peregrinibacteria bacterium CG10_big_fil_rev_8_21_14_0_10_55_24]
MSRTFLIAANWKMNAAPEGAYAPDSPYRTHSSVDVWVFPTFLDLKDCIAAELVSGGQCGQSEPSGAHTGDVSVRMLADAGCRAVLCGHSERRQGHGETNEDVATQAIAALEAGIHPVICIGETASQRSAGKEKAVVKAQLAPLPKESDITIAYEPVWAIGTGKTATPKQAQDMHAYIRSLLPADRRESTRILYGGSMKLENAQELLSQPDIDGGLIGGASLKPEDFRAIVETALRLSTR